MMRYSRRSRRLVAAGLALLGVGIAAAMVVGPFEWLRRQNEERQALFDEVESLRAQLVDREQIIAERQRLERTQLLRSDMIRADTPMLAGAALQGTLGNLVQSSGGVLEAAALDPPLALDAFTKVHARVDLLVDIEGLRDLLYAIETHRPTLIVEAVTLKRRSGNDLLHDLDVTMQIAAFTKAPLPTTTAATGTN